VVAFARKSRFAPKLTVYRDDGRGEVLLTAGMSLRRRRRRAGRQHPD
jgi:hypothetical protein